MNQNTNISDTLSNSQRWMITFTVMLAAIIEVLDMTIVNVSLAPMMGSLGASSDQITWVLTSYIVSSAIFMLLTGFLSARLGQKRLLIYNIIGFMIASVLCGISTSLAEIVFFRVLQGVFGASLVPLSQIILRNTYPRNQIGKAMAIWGIGIMVAPVLGPTIGGYITQHSSWRWVFYINVPVCILAYFMTKRYIRETVISKSSVDWVGMILMVLAVGCFQIFLDRGNSADWLQSHSMQVLFLTCIICTVTFIFRGLYNKNNIINLSLFKDRNYAISCILITMYCIGVLGVISVQPLLLENILNYPTETAGLVMAPRGLFSAIGMLMVSNLVLRYDPRKIMATGLFFTILGTYLMSGYNIETPQFYWMLSGSVQGLGMGLFFVPLASLAYITLKDKDIPEAAGLFSFGRNLGSSIGISILSTIIAREQQINWNRLGGNLTHYNNNLHQWFIQNNWTANNQMALSTLQSQLSSQSAIIAFIDSFWAVTLILLMMLPLILLLKYNPAKVGKAR